MIDLPVIVSPIFAKLTGRDLNDRGPLSLSCVLQVLAG